MSYNSARGIVVSAPSGSGKTTLVHRLLAERGDGGFSIAATSRPPRGTEVRFYGTLRSEVERLQNAGMVAVFDVDVAGGLRLKRKLGNSVRSIFIRPPSIMELRRRLESRATDGAEDIEMRVAKSASELEQAPRFDHIIENNNLDRASGELLELVEEFIGALRPSGN